MREREQLTETNEKHGDLSIEHNISEMWNGCKNKQNLKAILSQRKISFQF